MVMPIADLQLILLSQHMLNKHTYKKRPRTTHKQHTHTHTILSFITFYLHQPSTFNPYTFFTNQVIELSPLLPPVSCFCRRHLFSVVNFTGIGKRFATEAMKSFNSETLESTYCFKLSISTQAFHGGGGRIVGWVGCFLGKQMDGKQMVRLRMVGYQICLKLEYAEKRME